MHLTNETTYNTAQLRTLLNAVYRRLSRSKGRYKRWKSVTVLVKYAKQVSHYSGLAEIRGTEVILRIPHEKARKRLIAYLAEHEFRHLYGGLHGDGSFEWRWPTTFKKWAWADSFGTLLTRRPND